MNYNKFRTQNNDENENLRIEIPKDIENMQLPNPSLLQYYRDLEERIYWIGGGVDEGLYDLIDYILDFNRKDKGIPKEERKPIKLIIASPGGSLDVEKSLTAIIEMSETPVYGYAIGMVASAAAMIYLSCHKRYATNNSKFLFHQGSCSDVGGSYQEVQAFMESYKTDIEEMSKFYKEHTNYPAKTIDSKLSKGDWYIGVEEAKKNGVVHEIMTSLDPLL